MFGSSMNPKQRMALAIKAKQQAANPMGAPVTPPAPTQNMQAPATMNKSQTPIFTQGANELNKPHFFKLRQKLAKF